MSLELSVGEVQVLARLVRHGADPKSLRLFLQSDQAAWGKSTGSGCASFREPHTQEDRRILAGMVRSLAVRNLVAIAADYPNLQTVRILDAGKNASIRSQNVIPIEKRCERP